jgi:TatD DNase family protein
MSGDKQKGKELQKEYFLKHIDLANELNKPLIIHARAGIGDDAYLDILEILKSREVLPFSEKKGVIHCFISNLNIAKEFIDLGFVIGFTGIITFTKKAEEIQKVAKELPLQNILIETDSPYLAPEPFRGKRNEPMYVEEVAKKIAELKGIDIKEVIEQTAKNAMEVFKIII